MPTALIISASFRVAHISHLVASYNQMEELGYNSVLYIHSKAVPFLPKNVRYITSLSEIKNVDVAIFWFPAVANIKLMLVLKLIFRAKILYVFHEPPEKYSTYNDIGLSKKEICKIYLKFIFSIFFILLSNVVILPSKKALELYKKSICSKINKNIYQIPLIFIDEAFISPPKREFFSYIGTIAQDHAFEQFTEFIITLSNRNQIPRGLKFLIATRNLINHNPKLDKLINSGQLEVFEGKPLTDSEINLFYAKSYIVWNAYNRTTQSGVLAKASMFGTPALVKKENLSEFSIDGYNVKAVESNTDITEILNAVKEVIENTDMYSKNSRKIFESIFYYRTHNSKIHNILSSI